MKWFWTQYRGEIFAPGNGSLICPQAKKTRSKGQTWIPLGSRSHGGQNRPPWNQQHVQRRIRQTYLQVSVLQLIRLGTKTVTILFYSSCNQSTIVRLSIYVISVSIFLSPIQLWNQIIFNGFPFKNGYKEWDLFLSSLFDFIKKRKI